MKRTRRVLSGLAALALAACMAVPAAGGLTAGASGTITINSDDDAEHTYTAYQILTGTTIEVEGKEHLASIDWGSDINSQALMDDTDGKAAALFGSAPTSAADFADKIATYVGDDDIDGARAKEIAQFIANYIAGDGTIVKSGVTNVEDGYYLIKDVINESEDPSGDTLSLHMLQVIGKDTEFSTKKGKPSFEKKLKDAADTTGTVTEWQDGADYDIGDTVPFQLKATLPNDFGEYDSYKMVFHDDLSSGSEDTAVFNDPTNFKIWIDLDADGEMDANEQLTDIDPNITEGQGDFTITIEDIRKVKYLQESAEPERAEVAAGMSVYVEYEAVLNESAVIGSTGNWNEAYLTYSNNPNVEAEGDTSDTPSEEDTPHDKVVVFTYEVDATKIDGTTQDALNGAGFTLYKKYNGEQTGKGDNMAEYLGKAGEYWYKVGAEQVNADGNTFAFKGLDDGDYILEETTVPSGYNKMDNIEFTVTPAHDDNAEEDGSINLTDLNGTVSNGQVTFTPDTTAGKLSTTIENKEGTVLPGTGGIGTTIFYVVGGMLVVGAGVLLIARKRTQKEEQ